MPRRCWSGSIRTIWCGRCWTRLASLTLSAFYAAYRLDGRARPAYDPAMMVGLLMYAYARGNRSSRRIERACVEDVAYRVITANRAPDHSTIAEFRVRHEQALADLFGGVLELCKRAGLVSVGVIAVDGTKVVANASSYANVDYKRIAREILEEAARIDREEDELYGEARGDELPEHLRTAGGSPGGFEGSQAKGSMRSANAVSARSRGASRCRCASRSRRWWMRTRARCSACAWRARRSSIVPSGRRGWLRAARQQLDQTSRTRRPACQPIADRPTPGGRTSPLRRARGRAAGKSDL